MKNVQRAKSSLLEKQKYLQLNLSTVALGAKMY
jgi:hypothetical protein